MRIILITAALAALASPVVAQSWSGQGLVPSTIATSAGVPLTSSNGGAFQVDGQVQPIAYGCHQYIVEFNSYAETPAPCTGSQTPYFVPSGGATTVGNLPSGVDAPGSQVGILASGYYPDAGSPAGVSYFSGYIPLSAFANAAQSIGALGAKLDSFIATQQAINANQAVINANQQTVNANVSQALARLGRGVAMATSLALEGPIDGKTNRLSIGVGTYGDSNAVSLNYAHRSGPVDVGIAVSYAGGDTLGKAQVGFSW